MLKQLLNTLFIQTQGAYLRLDHETLKLEVEREVKAQVPLHHIGGMVLFGNVMVSPFLLHRCADDGRGVVWMTQAGRFRCRISGPTSGNVLLRKAQYEAQAEPVAAAGIARNVVAGKVRNCRTIMQRAARESESAVSKEVLGQGARQMAVTLRALERAHSLDDIRGMEGRAGRIYFENFSHMLRVEEAAFAFSGRNRRPPRDRVNAVLSFLYALLVGDCVAACEGVGLDPQFGYLHALRSGRSSLALDLMEELRPALADRLALALINRRQLTAGDFDERRGGAVHLNESGRKTVLTGYQTRKQEEVTHAGLGQQVPLGLVPHVQARLLARHLRGDLEAYPPFIIR